MYDPTMRVLTVLELLQTTGRMTGAQLAARLEVHPRTVQRYIARLQDLGVPVTATRGVGGAYVLRPGFRVPPLMFTNDEALAVLLGLRALRHLGLSAFAPATDGANAKLRRVLPTAIVTRVEQIQDAIDLDMPWMVEADAPLVLALAAAAHARSVVTLTYTTQPACVTHRAVEPYGVLRDEGRWYLIGRCRLREAIRCFRIDRVGELRLTQETYTIPAGFDARTTLRVALATLSARWATRVWVAARPEEVRQGLPLVRPILMALDGGTMVRCGVADLAAFATMLLALNCAIIVHEPTELRAAFAAVADRAARIAQDRPD